MRLTLDLQRRDPRSGKITVTKRALATRALGVVIIDMWNWHWCKTVTERAAAMVPRMNRALECLRAMGAQVFHCPTDIADRYAGTPAREAALATPRHPLPDRSKTGRRRPRGGGCMCGPGIACKPKLGWDAICPGLVIGDADLVAQGTQELHSICGERGIRALVYFGIATNMCLIGKPTGMMPMADTGMTVILARDLTDACTEYDPARGYTPDDGTAEVVRHLERHCFPTVHMVDELRKAGRWRDDWIVEPIRFAPWGVPMRPHLFEKPFKLTMTAPWLDGADIGYTLDGTRPAATSKPYTKPIAIRASATVRAAAFEASRRLSLESSACCARLLPKPPMPDVHVSDLAPYRTNWSFEDLNKPRLDKSFACTVLKMRGVEYEKGIGMRAPAQHVYELKPEYGRFVALAGINEVEFWDISGADVARHPSVVFKVFIDGELAAESPVMRISQEPWRFDVSIPRGGRLISLAATDAGDGNRQDYANWCNAGFVLKK